MSTLVLVLIILAAVMTTALTTASVRTDFSGDWEMKSALFEGSPVELPSGQVTLSLILAADGYKAVFHAGNRMMGGMIVDDEISDTEAGIHFTPMPSTRMMPPPEFRQVERFITQAVPLLNKATIVTTTGDVQLLLEGPTAETVFVPKETQDDNA